MQSSLTPNLGSPKSAHKLHSQSPATCGSLSLPPNCLPSTWHFVLSRLFCGPHTILTRDTGFTLTLTSFQSITRMFEPNLTECLQKTGNTAHKVPNTAPPHNCSRGPEAQTQCGGLLHPASFHGVRHSLTPLQADFHSSLLNRRSFFPYHAQSFKCLICFLMTT